jgi:hypothetical protein
MTYRALILIAAALSAAPADAAQPQDPASAAAPGQIDFTYNRSQPTASAADRTALQAQGVKLRDIILATLALADPRGFALHTSVVLNRPVSSRAGESDVVVGSVLSRRINVTRSKPDAKGRYPGDGEGPALIFAINKLEAALGYRSKAGHFTLPVERRERDGVLTFVRSGRDYTVITPPGLPAYQPVSIGDYVATSIEAFRADGAPQLATEMQAAAAQLTPAQKAAPYCETNTGPATDLANRCRHASAKPIVRLNPRLAPGTGAASRARIIVLSVPQLGQVGDAQERRRLRQAAGQLDIAALQALLTP